MLCVEQLPAPRPCRWLRVSLNCVALLVSVHCGSVWAGNFWYSTNAAIRSQFNSNLRLDPVDDGGALGVITDVGASLGFRDELRQITVSPRLHMERWLGDREFNTDDQGIDAAAIQRGERWQANVGVNFLRDSTLSSDFLVLDTASVRQRRRRESVQYRGGARYFATELVSLGVNASARDSSIPNPGTTGLLGSSSSQLQFVAEWRMNPRATVQVNTSRGLFESDNGNRTTTYGAGGSYSYMMGETSTFNVGASYRLSKLDPRVGADSTEDGVSANAEWRDRYARGNYRLSAGRALSPTASGFQVTRDTVALAWTHRFSERLQSTAALNLLRTQSLSGTSDVEDRVRSRMQLGVSYRLDPQWTVESAIRYVRQDVESRDVADSTAIWLGIRFRDMERALDW